MSGNNIFLTRQIWWFGIVIGIALFAIFLSPIVAQAGSGFEPVEKLSPAETKRLKIAPTKLVLNGPHAFVVGRSGLGQGILLKLDAKTLENIAQHEFKFVPEEIVVSTEGIIFVLGNDGVQSILQVLNNALTPIGRLVMPKLLGYPTAFLSPQGKMVIGSLRTKFSTGDFFLIDVSNPKKPSLSEDLQVELARRGVTGVWLDESENIIFLNGAWATGFFAVDTVTKKLLSSITFEYEKDKTGEPYSTFVLIGDTPCRAGMSSSFLIADSVNHSLALVDYDSAFRMLNIVAIVIVKVNIIKGSKVERLPNARILRPEILIASSCDQSVIWLGNIYSNQVIQFARNTNSSSLEKVGTLTLENKPTGISISEDGSFALAISNANQSVARFERIMTSGPTRVIGEKSVRELQRILTAAGYPVGSIDGIIGTNTVRAVGLVEKRYGVELNVKDVKGALETLRSTLK